jgi:hypothetical protein
MSPSLAAATAHLYVDATDLIRCHDSSSVKLIRLFYGSRVKEVSWIKRRILNPRSIVPLQSKVFFRPRMRDETVLPHEGSRINP